MFVNTVAIDWGNVKSALKVKCGTEANALISTIRTAWNFLVWEWMADSVYARSSSRAGIRKGALGVQITPLCLRT